MLPLHFSQSKKFLELMFNGEKTGFLGRTPELGKRIDLFFLKIDFYVCELEPKLEPCRGLRIASWHVPKNKDEFEKIKILGWFGPFGKYLSFADPTPLINAQPKEYFSAWTNRKKSRRNRWYREIESGNLQVIGCDIYEFIAHYNLSNLSKKIKIFTEKQIYKLLKIYDERLHCFLVKDIRIDKIIAGMSLVDEDEMEQIIFMHCFSDRKYNFLGVGMIDFCITFAKQKSRKYVNMVAMRGKGSRNKKWQGFTKFKLEFNPIVTYFRQSYFKITFNL